MHVLSEQCGLGAELGWKEAEGFNGLKGRRRPRPRERLGKSRVMGRGLF